MDIKEIDDSKLLNGEVVRCPYCKKGTYMQVHKEIPANKESHFKCSNCDSEIHFRKKLKI